LVLFDSFFKAPPCSTFSAVLSPCLFFNGRPKLYLQVTPFPDVQVLTLPAGLTVIAANSFPGFDKYTTTPLAGKADVKSGWPLDEFMVVRVPRGVKPTPDFDPVLTEVAPVIGGVVKVVKLTLLFKLITTS
jgi:hypothetical protein